MATTWLNLSQASQAAGITRRTLYNHIKQGKVTVSRDRKNNPVIAVSELIRVYGNVKLPEKPILSVSHRKNAQQTFPHEQLHTMQKELADLRQAVMLMLEDKTAREEERQHHDDERRKLQAEVDQLTKALMRKNKRFWSGWFK